MLSTAKRAAPGPRPPPVLLRPTSAQSRPTPTRALGSGLLLLPAKGCTPVRRPPPCSPSVSPLVTPRLSREQRREGVGREPRPGPAYPGASLLAVRGPLPGKRWRSGNVRGKALLCSESVGPHCGPCPHPRSMESNGAGAAPGPSLGRTLSSVPAACLFVPPGDSRHRLWERQLQQLCGRPPGVLRSPAEQLSQVRAVS